MTLQELDRTIYELLRKEVVKNELLPDITKYNTSEDYNAARDILIQSKKRLIEVYGVGVGEKRDEIISHSITIDRVNIPKGDLGSFGVIHYEKKEDESYNKYLMPPSTMEVDYDIRIVANSIKTERLCQDIVFNALGTKKYISTINNNCKYILLREGMFNISGNKLLEYSFRYKVKDVYLEESQLLDDNIAKIKNINRDIQLEKKTSEI